MLNQVKGRIKALEKESARALPVFWITFSDGQQRRMDALEVELHLAEYAAEKEDTKAITGYQKVGGSLPEGAEWRTFYKRLEDHIKEGGGGDGTRRD